jgi:hypothetical protein
LSALTGIYIAQKCHGATLCEQLRIALLFVDVHTGVGKDTLKSKFDIAQSVSFFSQKVT